MAPIVSEGAIVTRLYSVGLDLSLWEILCYILYID